jgi:hypothetical protein
MNKRRRIYLLAGAIVVVLLLLGGISVYAYQYWQRGTPQYSVRQLEKAIAAHDTNAANQYIDEVGIWSNLWPRFETAMSAANNYNPLVTAVINGQKDAMQSVFQTGVYNAIRSQNGTPYPLLDLLAKLASAKITVQGTTALADLTYINNGASYPVTIVLTQQPDRTWKITDIQGMENAMTAAAIQSSGNSSNR